ncbi:MAG: hypothetical protein HBSAPP03_09350 [Phycisphaerae bacterium]|nr:MAG: hypothetical protein HBSAPP03_09350 [Phycisphaerae bacterium]
MPEAPSDPDLLRRFLAETEAPCPACGYSLRALATDRCPECSAIIRLAVESPSVRLGAWVLAQVFLAMALGFDTVVLAIVTIAMFIEGPSTPAEWAQALTMFGGFAGLAGASGFMLWRVYRARRGWSRAEDRRRRWWAAGVFVATFIVHAAFGAILTRVL